MGGGVDADCGRSFRCLYAEAGMPDVYMRDALPLRLTLRGATAASPTTMYRFPGGMGVTNEEGAVFIGVHSFPTHTKPHHHLLVVSRKNCVPIATIIDCIPVIACWDIFIFRVGIPLASLLIH